MKKLLLALVATMLMMGCVFAEAEINTGEILDEYADIYGEFFEDNLPSESIPDFDATEILKELNKGEFSFSPSMAFKYLVKILFDEVVNGAKLLAIVLALSVLCSYLSGLKEGFGQTAITDSAFYACYIIIAGIAAASFYDTAVCASDAVKSIAFFMRVIVPVIIMALMTGGAFVSAATLEPVLLSMVEAAVWIIEAVFIPAVMLSAALSIAGGMSDKFKTDKLLKLFGSTIKWGLSLMLTIFVSFTGLKSIASSGVDGLTLKLSKFATSNLIPMVGGILSESVETVMSCSVVIKNSVGVMGVICVVLIALHPLVKIGAVLILFRITAAIVEIVTETKIVLCISRLADSVSMIFSILAAVTIMFVLVLTIMINAGSSAVYLGG